MVTSIYDSFPLSQFQAFTRPGQVKFYFELSFALSFDIDDKQYRHCFACVQWFKEYPNDTPFLKA